MKKPKTICIECEHHFFDGTDFCKAHAVEDEIDPISGKMKSQTSISYRLGYRMCFLINVHGKCKKFKKK